MLENRISLLEACNTQILTLPTTDIEDEVLWAKGTEGLEQGLGKRRRSRNIFLLFLQHVPRCRPSFSVFAVVVGVDSRLAIVSVDVRSLTIHDREERRGKGCCDHRLLIVPSSSTLVNPLPAIFNKSRLLS
ncbi:hypothetical protein CC2G_006997 [Coprinopsis cinerea AmutBmut pab1-1]|nr:hypothetical protein CC2G_006997 [Coprinopsis cinerea AmutBmut pab1-1]